MDSKTIHYIILISKLRDIINYINLNFNENDIKSYITECKNLCIEKIKDDPDIKVVIEEINNFKLEEKPEVDTTDNMLSTVTSITNLLGGENEISINEINPNMFDNFGNGLIKMLKINSAPIQHQEVPQINLLKNEIKNTINSNNLSYQIKKKSN